MWSQTKLLLLCVCFLMVSQCRGLAGHGIGCRTPDNKIGDCKPIRQCEPMMHFLRTLEKPYRKQIIQYVQSFECSENSESICCPPGPVLFEGPPDVSQHKNYRLLPAECGYLDSGSKIIGGQNARMNEFPWMALLSYKTRRGPVFGCGGTIINERYILTAAHCLRDLEYPLLGVRVGEHNIRTKVDCEATGLNSRRCNVPVQDLAIEEILIHPEFNATMIMNDIGLIRVTRMNMNVANARPVCLPIDTARGMDLDGQRVIVTGWGRDETGLASDILKKIELPIVSLSECQNIYRAEPQAVITKKQLCAGSKHSLNILRGDSGGPVHSAAYVNGDTRYVQEGVVSFGPSRCLKDGCPEVYTRVDYYMDWLLDVMKP